MSGRIGCGLSTESDPRVGAIEAAEGARRQLDGAPVDLCFVFACGGHLAAPEATLEGVHDTLLPDAVVGCGAGGVVGGGREVEDGTAVAVWAASLDGAECEPFHVEAEPEGDHYSVSGFPDLTGASGVVLLPDPYSFPTDQVLAELRRRAPGVPVLGGLSSARTFDGTSALFCGEEVVEGGAVGLRMGGVDLVPCVSQGAAPVGPELTITAAQGHVISELAGRPALEKIRQVVEALDEHERRLVGGGLLLGIVIEPGKPEYEQGDFLVRGLLGADPDAGSVAVGAAVEPGQVVRLHVRDAASADRDLRRALNGSLADRGVAGALLFSCNGRGRGMFGEPDHDAAAIARELGGPPTAGFFAAGEIGPVGGASFLHGFTATLALFGA